MLLPLLLLAAPQSTSNVDLVLTPATINENPSCVVEVGLVATSSVPTEVSAIDALLSWDPAQLQFIQAVPSDEDWFVTAFLNDPDGINDDTTDGDALYSVLANPASPLLVDGTVPVATFLFQVIADGDVNLLTSLGGFGQSRVIGTHPGLTHTGALVGPASVFAVPFPSLEVTRLGTPPNPGAFNPGLTSGPVIGATWDPFVDHSVFFPGALVDIAGLGPPSPMDLPTAFGTILVDITQPIFLYFTPAGVPFDAPVPELCALIGRTGTLQAVSVDGIEAQIANAIDFTIGTL